MRISDWSSDVCSSDLHEDDEDEERQPEGIGHPRLIAINAQSQSTPVGFDVVSGELTDGAGQFSLTQLNEGRCPACLSNKRHGRPAMLSFRFGTPFLTQNAEPILLEIGRASCRERVCQYV